MQSLEINPGRKLWTGEPVHPAAILNHLLRGCNVHQRKEAPGEGLKHVKSATAPPPLTNNSPTKQGGRVGGQGGTASLPLAGKRALQSPFCEWAGMCPGIQAF